MLTGTFYSTQEAAEYTGLTESTIRRLISTGTLESATVGNSHLIERYYLDCLNYSLAKFLTQTEIAKRYGISRQAVHKAFAKHKIRSETTNTSIKRNATLYHVHQVSEFAKSIGWTEPGG